MNNQIIAPIIYPSAADFWKSGFPTRLKYGSDPQLLTDLPSEYKVSSVCAKNAVDHLDLCFPLYLFSNGINPGHKDQFYITRCQKSPLPPRSFFRIPNVNIYVACPELTFLQAARHLDLISLVQLGFDLCSQYYFDERSDYWQSERAVVTTPERLMAYAKSSKGTHGSAKALRAAKYVRAASNSPMETRLAIILLLPVKLGGYGLSRVEMNRAIRLSKLGIKLLGIYEIHGDLVWAHEKLAVEYNSKLAHNNDAAFYNDSNRATALYASGWKYIGVTPDNIKSFEAMENLAGIIRGQLKLRANKETLKHYEKKRRAVYDKLFNS